MTYSAKPHQPLTEALRAAVQRGVAVSVVVETLQGAGSALSGEEPYNAFTGIAGIKLWHWPTSRRTEHGAKMHAKLAVADRHVLLITSANLTQSGVSKNIEAGLLIRGGPAPTVAPSTWLPSAPMATWSVLTEFCSRQKLAAFNTETTASACWKVVGYETSPALLGDDPSLVPQGPQRSWGSVYTIIRPACSGDSWKAVARFGSHDVLSAETGYELLELVRRHYPGNTGEIRRLGR